MKNLMVVAMLGLTVFGSCVSERRFNDERAKVAQCEEERARLKSSTMDLEAQVAELGADLEQARKRLSALGTDTSVMGNSLRKLTTNYDKLNETYEKLLTQMDRLREGSAADQRKLNTQLDATRADLQKREDELHKLELALAKKEGNLEQLDKELKASRASLEQREKRVKELESVLSRKDSAVVALKDKVAAALLGFKDQGLTVEQRNGKVYVSMEERLLFASGSWVVDVKGVEALKKLAKVLESHPDVNVLIEGHTDNVPYKGNAQVKDNWDLSVMRATAIVKVLLSGSALKTSQLTAAGRGEFMPMATNETSEGRAKNRRSEIIITPKLDELFKILDDH